MSLDRPLGWTASRVCPKCGDSMRPAYHDSRASCGFSFRGEAMYYFHPPGDSCTGCERANFRCPGGRDEHLFWSCACGFVDVTPCHDAAAKEAHLA